jgi:hypothetical protein
MSEIKIGRPEDYPWADQYIPKPNAPSGEGAPEQQPTEARCAGSSGSGLDGAPPPITYQPQQFWSDGDFDFWVNLERPTQSKYVVRERLKQALSNNPTDKIRVLKLYTRAEVVDDAEFHPNMAVRQADNSTTK